MKKYSLILMVFCFISCLSEKKQEEEQEKENTNLKEEITTPKETEPIIGERIDGPANVRDTIDGEVLFTLYDNTFVESTPKENDWNKIGILPTNPKSDFENDHLKKGVKIIVDGQIVGETKKDVELSMGLIGYTHKENIKAHSIIENILMDLFKKQKNKRNLEDFKSFITNFKLEKETQFEGMTVYYNYENWIDDPSPMMRIGLVFKNKNLVAILHSRPLTIEGTKDNKLDYAFDCLTFTDVKDADEIVKIFNHFVHSVD
ncbi:hypothetical protein FIA58_003305 [Flavobacterium jejuense]|uniref:Lipoprotein n=1 Tax=Flavobacterium jejuense TaxID=1544455 RepID=A0ABX0IM77_9FLAO|nr:hypothetical protein [Flavobacterium jejuense]NHN24693.1 hypothetical protein [Flavobacterium jejuense]